MKIFFVGYMASGKSSLGKRVARNLNIPFLDMDKAMEENTKLSIPDLFASQGERAFRKLESEFLDEMKQDETSILIATGGGTPCFHENIERMNTLGLTVYLKRSAKELAHRIWLSKKSRPLTDALSELELVHFVENQLAEREVYYNRSKMIVVRESQNTEELANLIRSFIENSNHS